ncbi:hypothetical protein FAVG1_12835 [Fusarium avenaceum]|nr:hypothetical protein FAVG1_12835 [Fusarium avenaceum]
MVSLRPSDNCAIRDCDVLPLGDVSKGGGNIILLINLAVRVLVVIFLVVLDGNFFLALRPLFFTGRLILRFQTGWVIADKLNPDAIFKVPRMANEDPNIGHFEPAGSPALTPNSVSNSQPSAKTLPLEYLIFTSSTSWTV